ncbi:MAG: HAMP domain-containing sensor histidine kinase [Desulfovibrionaceae bacterium]|nr:HAMP domain-containing sensor histidine kinase [Desulfovibrionaceae bacterium]
MDQDRRTWRISITIKLLVWCLTLVAIFYATTSYLFVRIKDVVADSEALVDVNYEIELAAQRLIQTLLSVEENRKRYEILQKNVYMDYVIEDLSRFGRLLNQTLDSHPALKPALKPLTQEFSITLSKGSSPAALLIPDATVNSWLEKLSAVRRDNQRQMEARLNELNARGQQAARIGFIGLIFSIGLGLAGSLFIAYRLNLSLGDIRRGIKEIGRDGRIEPVRVRSNDELRELATAFNNMAERLRLEEQMRSDFISMLSHEVRTPLTSIRESNVLVRDGVFGEVNERQKRFLDISLQEIERLSALLERLMTVSSLEASLPELNIEALDASTLITSALDRIRPAAVSKDIALRAETPEPPCPVMADRDNLQQVLLNLLGNAIKFSSPGGQVTVSAARSPDKAEAVFRVRDQGLGIPEAEQAYVFQKYYRHSSVRGSVDGVGLGLSISKAIVEAHGGRIWLASEEGAGSEFCFSLPLVQAMV